MTLVINSEYTDLLKFIFGNLRQESKFPMRDNFMLVKNITGVEHSMLQRYGNYMIVSQTYFTEVWGRDEIFKYVATKLNSRRKPTYTQMSKEEFEKNMKVFFVTGTWVTEDVEEGTYALFQNIDLPYRYKEYFKVRKELPVHAIFLSLLTFIYKSIKVADYSGIGKGYAGVLSSKKRRVSENLSGAISNYGRYDKNVDEDMRVLKFISEIGG